MTTTRREFMKGILGASTAAVMGVRVAHCPGCGASVESGLERCKFCGTYFIEKIKEEPESDGYVSLHREDGTEPLDPAYERQPVIFKEVNGNKLKTKLRNVERIEFPEATRSWGIIYGGKIWNREGEAVLQFDLNLPFRLESGDTASFLPGALEVMYG